jgi:hypothetical protein
VLRTLGQEGGGGGLQDGGVALVRLEGKLRPHPQATVRTRVGYNLHLNNKLLLFKFSTRQTEAPSTGDGEDPHGL